MNNKHYCTKCGANRPDSELCTRLIKKYRTRRAAHFCADRDCYKKFVMAEKLKAGVEK